MLIRDVKVVYGQSRAPDVDNPGPVRCAAQVVKMLRAWGIDDSPQERFVVVHLDTRYRVTGIQEVARGTLGSVEVHPREVFRGAVLQGSKAVILAHNHPSGDCHHSVDDKTVTLASSSGSRCSTT